MRVWRRHAELLHRESPLLTLTLQHRTKVRTQDDGDGDDDHDDDGDDVDLDVDLKGDWEQLGDNAPSSLLTHCGSASQVFAQVFIFHLSCNCFLI